MPKLKLPNDPLLELERNVIASARLLGRAAREWLEFNPGKLPTLEVVLCHREHRQTVEGIEKLRIARDRQRLAEQIAAVHLPPIDDKQIIAEIDRLVTERLQLLTSVELSKMADERRLEEGTTLTGPESESLS